MAGTKDWLRRLRPALREELADYRMSRLFTVGEYEDQFGREAIENLHDAAKREEDEELLADVLGAYLYDNMNWEWVAYSTRHEEAEQGPMVSGCAPTESMAWEVMKQALDAQVAEYASSDIDMRDVSEWDTREGRTYRSYGDGGDSEWAFDMSVTRV